MSRTNKPRQHRMADDNRRNHNAVRAELLAIIVGLVMIATGVVLACIPPTPERVISLVARWRYAGPLLATLAFLAYRWHMRESLHWPLLIIGASWLIGGLARFADLI